MQLVSDGVAAYHFGNDAFKVINGVIERLSSSGANPIYPEIRVRTKEGRIEFSAGLELTKKKFFEAKVARLNLPKPDKVSIFALTPVYRPLTGIYAWSEGDLYIDTDGLNKAGDSFRISMEYPLQDDEGVRNLVYSSSPKDTLVDKETGDEKEAFWLHAELKTLELLRKAYSVVRVEDVELKVEVAVKEHIRELFDRDIRFEMMMMAKLTSRDRNERSKAAFYVQHHKKPKFKGNIFKVMNSLQELLQPSRFRPFLDLEGYFRYAGCQKGVSLAEALEPIYLPNYMSVTSSTDLTLDEPARDGKLIYKKSQFKKKVEKAILEAQETEKEFVT